MQIGELAEKNDNVYFHLCYESNVKWDHIKSPYHLKSVEIQIAEYGQAPVQLFTTPHPKKKIRIPSGVSGNQNKTNKDDEEKRKVLEQMKASDQELRQLKYDLDNLNKAFKQSIRDEAKENNQNEYQLSQDDANHQQDYDDVDEIDEEMMRKMGIKAGEVVYHI